MLPSAPTNPSSFLRKAVEAEQQSDQPEPKRTSPQVTPMGLFFALTVAVAIGTTAIMVSS